MVLGTPLNKKQCVSCTWVSCTCLIGDGIRFSKAVLLHTKFHNKQKESGERRRDRKRRDQVGRLAYKVTVWQLLSSRLTYKGPKNKESNQYTCNTQQYSTTEGFVWTMKFDRSQTGIFKNYVHILNIHSHVTLTSWIFSSKRSHIWPTTSRQ